MILPIVNINGTDRRDLLQDYILAKEALETAVRLLGAASPHGRDYQTMPQGSFYAAQQEHADRIVKVRSVLAEIETIAEHLV